jgi:hypothetical protein
VSFVSFACAPLHHVHQDGIVKVCKIRRSRLWRATGLRYDRLHDPIGKME